MRGDTLPTAEVEALWTSKLRAVRNRILAIPSRVSYLFAAAMSQRFLAGEATWRNAGHSSKDLVEMTLTGKAQTISNIDPVTNRLTTISCPGAPARSRDIGAA